MDKSKVHMPKELKKKCHVAIHAATAASAAAGAIPIPMSDAIPITAAQIGMVIALGKAFGVSLSESTAKSIIGVGITQQAGRAVCGNILKIVPGAGQIVGGIICASTAAALTEALGWVVADDFYRLSQGKEPEVLDAVNNLKGAFEDMNFSKGK